MPGGQYDLFEKKISATYHRVVQYDSGSQKLLDGRGDAINGFVLSGSVHISGTLYVDTLYASESFIDVSGSTKFGNSLDDTHQYTGSLSVTNSINLDGNININGNISRKSKTITSNYNVSTGDNIIFVNSISAFSASLFDATNNNGKSLYFKVIGNFPFTIQPSGSQTIDGNSNLIITDKWTSVEIITSGSNWYII